MSTPTEMRKGNVILHNGKPYAVTSIDHRTPGRRPSFVQAGLKNLMDGTTLEFKFMNSATVTFMETDTKPMEFSYVDDQGFHMMEPEGLDEVLIPMRMVEDLKDYMVEGTIYNVLFIEGRAARVVLPASVEMEVIESPEGVRGDTSSSPQKTIILQTGLAVLAPLFIKKGEKVKVSTDDGSYQGRA